MTNQELRDALAELEINQMELARLLGVEDRTVRRWVADAKIPGPVVVIVSLWLERPELVGVVRKMAEHREPARFPEAA